MPELDLAARALLFEGARSQNGWRDAPVTEADLRRIYEIMHLAPTSMNCQPMRLIFLTTPEAKERLRPALSPGNMDKTMAAPVVAVIGYDTEFHHHLPKVFPPKPDAKAMYEGKPDFIEKTAFRNGTLQGAYLILGIRAAGFDAGPMSGFDNVKVDAEFWPEGTVKSNFICAIGKGDPAKVFQRLPRWSFDEIATVL